MLRSKFHRCTESSVCNTKGKQIGKYSMQVDN